MIFINDADIFFHKRNFSDGGLAKPLSTFLQKTRGNKFDRVYSGQYYTKPHWNYLIKSAAQNFGNAERGHALYPRNRGPLANIEKGPWYQAASRLCLESKPAPYTLESMICSGVIDFGISALIESQVLQDLLTCIAAGIRFAIRKYLIKLLIVFI